VENNVNLYMRPALYHSKTVVISVYYGVLGCMLKEMIKSNSFGVKLRIKTTCEIVYTVE